MVMQCQVKSRVDIGSVGKMENIEKIGHIGKIGNKGKQAGAELCQAQHSLG